MKRNLTAKPQRTQSEKRCPSGRIAFFVFRPFSEKQKKKFLCVLRASAVKIGLKKLLTLFIEILRLMILAFSFSREMGQNSSGMSNTTISRSSLATCASFFTPGSDSTRSNSSQDSPRPIAAR